MKLEYGYGTNTQNNGSLRSQKISFNGLTQPFEQTYSYDDLNRLLSAEEKVNNSTTWKQTFSYDRYGNRRFDANNTTTLLQNNNLTNPQIDTATNRFSSGQNYVYDKNGSLTQDANGIQFAYDAENHQKEVKNSSNQTVGLYHYDGEGRRVKKISSTETVIFVYDGKGQLAAEYSTEQAQTPQTSYLTTDHLGSPRIITNELGEVTTRKDYMAFGEETFTQQRTSSLNYDNQSETRKGYTGYEKDDESGLDFAQARYYNSVHGRFTSVDPLMASANLKNPQTFNRYSYVLNSPYKYTDPLGLISRNTSACGGECSSNGATSNPGQDDPPKKQEAKEPEPNYDFYYIANGVKVNPQVNKLANAAYKKIYAARFKQATTEIGKTNAGGVDSTQDSSGSTQVSVDTEGKGSVTTTSGSSQTTVDNKNNVDVETEVTEVEATLQREVAKLPQAEGAPDNRTPQTDAREVMETVTREATEDARRDAWDTPQGGRAMETASIKQFGSIDLSIATLIGVQEMRPSTLKTLPKKLPDRLKLNPSHSPPPAQE